jgi:hypothetical protein
MSILLVKIKFEYYFGSNFFTQYYEVNVEQHEELKKLYIERDKHICHSELIDTIKYNKINYPNIIQNQKCLFCDHSLRKISYIDFVCVNSNILHTESNFTLDILLQICKNEEELPLHKIKIDEIIKNKLIKENEEKIRKAKEELEKSLEHQRLTGLYTYEVKCDNLRRGDYVMIDDHPCKLIDIRRIIKYRD